MADFTQQVVVFRDGTEKVNVSDFALPSLGTTYRGSVHYLVDPKERDGRLQLTSPPTVLGGLFPVTRINYSNSPSSAWNDFEFTTNEFVEHFALLIKQPITLWLDDGATMVIIESRMALSGPKRQPPQLRAMLTAALGAPLMLDPDAEEQEFQLLAEPFGGNVIKKTVRATITHADDREKANVEIIPYVAALPGSGRIIDDRTGAIFTAKGFRPQRNYEIVVDFDGDFKRDWQATTKTGPFYDALRKV